MIELKQVSKEFQNKTVIKDMTLSIQHGDFVVFSGNSGCGKTTLLNMIGGLEKPTKGEILVDGVNIYKCKNLEKYFTYTIGFLFQNFALIENKTVRQNLEMVQKKARSGLSVDEALTAVGIAGLSDVEVYKLSGGEQQRVAIARLMFKQCEIILADEPTGSLDPENTEIVMGYLHQLNAEGKTVILVTHNEKIINSEEKVIRL